ncbi:OmpA family protein [Lutibacter flavus]|uniref:Outer membrane protein OmpA n=1 Tax=Lutibacter flavus TaxID=691689 RepID=A0A238X4C4_9FLAO|nr:OmpA family protein [Lutibacter flavus]SNR53204.1 Outer membrane protein OmpA [Lutibacter flavus]
MKNKQLLLPKILLLFGLFFLIPNQSEAQFLKKLKEKAEKKIEREAEKRAERRVNKKIDKEFDKAEDILDGEGKEKTTENEENSNKNEKGVNDSNTNETTQKSNKPTVVWSKYDFVPGDTIIFEDGPSTDEENGEFPSRWDLLKGVSEIGNMNGENVIMFLEGGSAAIIPYLKNAKEDYLPEIFTLEMDLYFEPGNHGQRFWIKLKDDKNQKGKGVNESLEVYVNGLSFLNSEKSYPGTEKYNWGNNPIGGWKHISIAYTKGKFKAYMDDTRLINVPHLDGNPTGITLTASGPREFNLFAKNIRIAKGGVKYYDRVLSEGKIIVNGIKFDVNKATLKPESMGPINKIYQLMVDNPMVNFSVEGHTDSDGDDASNMTLSQTRGKAVMDKLISMGIAANRLKSNGFGESKPIDNNGTPEGKANNRRVEFVKFSGTTSTNSTTTNNSNNSVFNDIDKKTIAIKLESLPESINIPISNISGIINGKGTIILYATSDGNLGKMEILNVDENDNHKLTVKYVTYNYNGSVLSKSNNLEIQGTYTCDLDKGKTENVIYSERDFHLGIQDSKTASLYNGETAILKVLK